MFYGVEVSYVCVKIISLSHELFCLCVCSLLPTCLHARLYFEKKRWGVCSWLFQTLYSFLNSHSSSLDESWKRQSDSLKVISWTVCASPSVSRVVCTLEWTVDPIAHLLAGCHCPRKRLHDTENLLSNELLVTANPLPTVALLVALNLLHSGYVRDWQTPEVCQLIGPCTSSFNLYFLLKRQKMSTFVRICFALIAQCHKQRDDGKSDNETREIVMSPGDKFRNTLMSTN